MAAGNLCICVLLALAAGNLIMAEEDRAWPMFINPMDFFNMFFGGNSSRTRRAAEETQARFLPYFTSCNYTNSSQAGSQCRDCNSVVRCYPNSLALVRQCSGFLRYCNEGRCARQPGSQCNVTSG